MVNVYKLTQGTVIRIRKDFRDVYGGEFKEGTILHFTRREYLPYHSGHTVMFEEADMYLCDADDTYNIVLNRGDEFYELYTPT